VRSARDAFLWSGLGPVSGGIPELAAAGRIPPGRVLVEDTTYKGGTLATENLPTVVVFGPPSLRFR
jgi:hypothetical protein